jgi:hypothetical protein
MKPDVNVLVAAFLTDHTHHDAARSGLDQVRHACLTVTFDRDFAGLLAGNDLNLLA